MIKCNNLENIRKRLDTRNDMIECYNESIAKLIEYNRIDILLLRELERTGNIE